MKLLNPPLMSPTTARRLKLELLPFRSSAFVTVQRTQGCGLEFVSTFRKEQKQARGRAGVEPNRVVRDTQVQPGSKDKSSGREVWSVKSGAGEVF